MASQRVRPEVAGPMTGYASKVGSSAATLAQASRPRTPTLPSPFQGEEKKREDSEPLANDRHASKTPARRARYRGLCARQEQRTGRGQNVQAVVERDTARAEPARDRGLQGRRRSSRRLSGRLGHRAARG